MKKIISLGKFIIEKKEFRNLIKDSYKTYIKAENSIKKRIELFSYSKEISFVSTEGNFLESYKKSFFTFLMISILKHSKIEEERLVKYGEIIICLRTIITCTDNIVDNEKKGVVFLTNIKNTIVNNTLLLMTFQNILTNISKAQTLFLDYKNAQLLHNKLYNRIFVLVVFYHQKNMGRIQIFYIHFVSKL